MSQTQITTSVGWGEGNNVHHVKNVRKSFHKQGWIINCPPSKTYEVYVLNSRKMI